MDILTLVGLLSGISIVVLAILSGSSLWDFVNLPSIGIVICGTLAVTLIKFRLGSVASSLQLSMRTVFLERSMPPTMLVQQIRELAQVMRKEGILGLENYESEDPFLKKAISLCVDGHSPEFLEEALMQEMQQVLERYDIAEKILRGIGDTAPALGMLGTLVGLVQMLNNMQDPSTIGPAMAVALLTTFYGAFIAQMMALPLADKLALKAQDEQRNMMLVFTSIRNLMKGQNPRVVLELVMSYLTPQQRAKTLPTNEA